MKGLAALLKKEEGGFVSPSSPTTGIASYSLEGQGGRWRKKLARLKARRDSRDVEKGRPQNEMTLKEFSIKLQSGAATLASFPNSRR